MGGTHRIKNKTLFPLASCLFSFALPLASLCGIKEEPILRLSPPPPPDERIFSLRLCGDRDPDGSHRPRPRHRLLFHPSHRLRFRHRLRRRRWHLALIPSHPVRPCLRLFLSSIPSLPQRLILLHLCRPGLHLRP